MTTLAEYRARHPGRAPQLPPHWFTSAELHRREQEALFAQTPAYVGHELMIPREGDYHTLSWQRDAQALVRGRDGVARLLSNVCRHRQAVMLRGRGNARRVVCPLHRWVYTLQGELEGAPRFDPTPCLHLDARPLQSWRGLLFEGGARDVAADLARLAPHVASYFDFDRYELHSAEVTRYACNWKTFIEVYLEDYHVVPFHPGLGRFVDCERLEWQFGEQFSVQAVGLRDALRRPGTPVYERWHREARASYEREGAPLPEHGAVWLLYYPSLTVEWYPNTLVISNVLPDGPEGCRNVVEFYYPKGLAAARPEFAEAQQAAYRETAVEDEELCARMQEGRAALAARGVSERGPYLPALEDGLEHFNYWVRERLGEV
ncbi:MAG: aromatic ring-hydroxylating dioxygenase subunit alpha [Deltaproteobacteria bacterium]|nr:aromatic ring-hydroxylating dioxygenase subunit alpha [Deltaproteobacteria bacterium]